jgi:hypothetical protein
MPASRWSRGTCRLTLCARCIAIIAASLMTFFFDIDSCSGLSDRSAPERNTFSPSRGDKKEDASSLQRCQDSLAQTGALLAQNTQVQSNPFQDPLAFQEKNSKPHKVGHVKVLVGNIRQKPTTKSQIIDKVRSGDKVTLVEQQDEWYIVKLPDDRVGWAHERLFFKGHRTQVTTTKVFKEIKEIRVEVIPQGEERAVFLLNGSYPPHMFALEGERPKVVCDFFDARLADGMKRSIEVNGSLIQQVRIGIHEGARPKVRVVLDLAPHHNYDVQQILLKEKNLYTVIVKRQETSDKI